MALDSLLDSLVKQGGLTAAPAGSARGSIDAAYRAVRDPNLYQPVDFQSAMAKAAAAIRGLKSL